SAVRRIDVVEPELNSSACAELVDAAAAYVVALPAGSEWTIIGAQIGDVARPEVETTRGVLAYMAFEPQWALSATAGLETAALRLSNGSSRPSGGFPTASVALT